MMKLALKDKKSSIANETLVTSCGEIAFSDGVADVDEYTANWMVENFPDLYEVENAKKATEDKGVKRKPI